MADTRTPQQRSADDALARLDEITVTPELWVRGVRVDATAAGFPPYVLTKRTFATRADADRAKAGYDALCAAGCAREKAYRIYLSDESPTADDIRGLLNLKLALP